MRQWNIPDPGPKVSEMFSNDAANRQADLPEPPQSPSANGEQPFEAEPWSDDFADALNDPAGTNLFSAEIENVNASDWDLEASSIWGDEGELGAEDGDILGMDFPL